MSYAVVGRDSQEVVAARVPLRVQLVDVLARGWVEAEQRTEVASARRPGLDCLSNLTAVRLVNREYFETGVKDLADAELSYPGWLGRLLTHPVEGLENYQTLLKTLTEAKGAIKVYCDVVPM